MPIETIVPKGSKEQRYDAIIPFIANGSIRFKGERRGEDMYMSGENGFKEFQFEYSSFPRGGRDDILDALWIAVNDLTSNIEAVGIGEIEATLSLAEIEANEEGYEGEQRRRYLIDRISMLKEEERDDPRDRVLSGTGRGSLFHRSLR